MNRFSLRPVNYFEDLIHSINYPRSNKKGEDDPDPYFLRLSAQIIVTALTHIFN